MGVPLILFEIVGDFDSRRDAREVGFGKFAFRFVDDLLVDLLKLIFGEGLLAENRRLLLDNFVLGVGVQCDYKGRIFAVASFDLIFKLSFNRRQCSIAKTYISLQLPLSKSLAFSWFANCTFDDFVCIFS